MERKKVDFEAARVLEKSERFLLFKPAFWKSSSQILKGIVTQRVIIYSPSHHYKQTVI